MISLGNMSNVRAGTELSLIGSLDSPNMISLGNMSNVSNVSADTENSYLLNSLPQLSPLLFSAVQYNCPCVKPILNSSSLFLRSVNFKKLV